MPYRTQCSIRIPVYTIGRGNLHECLRDNTYCSFSRYETCKEKPGKVCCERCSHNIRAHEKGRSKEFRGHCKLCDCTSFVRRIDTQ